MVVLMELQLYAPFHTLLESLSQLIVKECMQNVQIISLLLHAKVKVSKLVSLLTLHTLYLELIEGVHIRIWISAKKLKSREMKEI